MQQRAQANTEWSPGLDFAVFIFHHLASFIYVDLADDAKWDIQAIPSVA